MWTYLAGSAIDASTSSRLHARLHARLTVPTSLRSSLCPMPSATSCPCSPVVETRGAGLPRHVTLPGDRVPSDLLARSSVPRSGTRGRPPHEVAAAPTLPGGDRRGRDAAWWHRQRRLPRGLAPHGEGVRGRDRRRGGGPGGGGPRAAVARRQGRGVPRLPRYPGGRMNRLAAILGDKTPVVLDGGMGTLLQDRGLTDGGAGELWNVEQPEVVRESHEAYARAGARILTTNTFGGSRPRLQMHGLEHRVHELNRAAAAIASAVADAHGALVAGDLGPTGELMAPLGTMDADAVREVFAEQLVGLRDGGIDLVLIETMSDLAEVRAAVDAAREVVPELPVIATLSFDTNLRTMMGVRPADAVRTLAQAGVDAVGANCGRGPGEMEAIAAQMVEARPPGLLLAAQSNAGLPQVVGDHFEYDASPSDLGEHARALHKLGVDLIGACCGSTPDHIAAIQEAIG